MSTVSKINPEVRGARTARRKACLSLARSIRFIPNVERQLAAIVLLDIMNDVRTRSNRTGTQKSEMFAKLMQKLMPAEQVAA